MNTIQQFMDRGGMHKRNGDFYAEKDCFVKALELDPLDMTIYVNLAKVAHLLKAQTLAIICYLAATHLQLAPIEQSIYENNLPKYLENQYNAFPKEIEKNLPAKSGFVIYIDINLPRHVAHSILDLSQSNLRKSQPSILSLIYMPLTLKEMVHIMKLYKNGD